MPSKTKTLSKAGVVNKTSDNSDNLEAPPVPPPEPLPKPYAESSCVEYTFFSEKRLPSSSNFHHVDKFVRIVSCSLVIPPPELLEPPPPEIPPTDLTLFSPSPKYE